MSLFTKSIFKEKSPADGIRISVMSRHTLNDGTTPDLRITPDKFDEHLLVLAPPSNLIGDFYNRRLEWQDYERKYLEYLRKHNVLDAVRQLAKRATHQDITLLCVEENAERCHRRLLAEECQRYEPNLIVVHR